MQMAVDTGLLMENIFSDDSHANLSTGSDTSGDDPFFYNQIPFQAVEPTSVLDYAYLPRCQNKFHPDGKEYNQLPMKDLDLQQILNSFSQPQMQATPNEWINSTIPKLADLACDLDVDDILNFPDSSSLGYVGGSTFPESSLETDCSDSIHIQGAYNDPSVEFAQYRSSERKRVHSHEEMWGGIVPKSDQRLLNEQIVHHLMACAEAVEDQNYQLVQGILARLSSQAIPFGSSIQRLASYFMEALAARATYAISSVRFGGLSGHKLFFYDKLMRTDIAEAFSVFYDSLPNGRFAHLTMNQILLDAVETDKKIHVIDFQSWYGGQWPSFFQGLAMRPGGAPTVRMTAIGSSVRDLKENGDMLLACARTFNIELDYCPLLVEYQEFDIGMLQTRKDEAILINSFCQLQHLLNKGSHQLHGLLRGLKSLNSKVMVMAETDAEHNSPLFMKRFVECLNYFSGIFDALDASMAPTSVTRLKIEELLLAPRIRNIIACEGESRVERHESMRSWQRRMESTGFMARSLSSRTMSQASQLLNHYYSQASYGLSSERGSVTLRWQGMPLMTVFAWI